LFVFPNGEHVAKKRKREWKEYEGSKEEWDCLS
jgi:hypothetical protein